MGRNRLSRLGVIILLALVGLWPNATSGADTSSVSQLASHALSGLLSWEESAAPVGYIRYIQSSEALAEAVSEETGVNPRELGAAWESADRSEMVAVLAALSQVGNRYQYASHDPDQGLDCSGLVGYAWSVAGVELPRTSGDQIRAAEQTSTPGVGDLLWYPGHIMLSLGVGDYVVHSANRKTGVTLGQATKWSRVGEL